MNVDSFSQHYRPSCYIECQLFCCGRQTGDSIFSRRGVARGLGTVCVTGVCTVYTANSQQQEWSNRASNGAYPSRNHATRINVLLRLTTYEFYRRSTCHIILETYYEQF